MSEEHRCTEECIGQLEDIIAQLQVEHQEDLSRTQQLAEALREALHMVEDAGRAYVNYSPERLKELRSILEEDAGE